MKKNFLSIVIILILSPILESCTKPENSEKQITVYSEKYADSKKKIAEITLNINSALEKRLNKTDLLIWSLQDKKGQILAVAIVEDLFFPHKIVIFSGHLRAPIEEGAPMIFSARIVKKGEEYLAPQKNQLTASYGYFDEVQGIKNSLQNIDQARLKKIVKKIKVQEAQKFVVGDKIDVEFK